jgi:hypothetical protein
VGTININVQKKFLKLWYKKKKITLQDVYLGKVAREVVGGPRGPIVIIVEVIQCKVD